ncbi:MAG: molybdenum cofactor guanylyltransferase [Planctomycetes bacterium]|nr:molybdenum cofactor guanylyltransferase [Planctomycetota bacterium]
MTRKTKRDTVAGAILAGGNARRIGCIAKGTLKVHGNTSIIECLINEMRHAGINDIVIIANDSKPYQDYGVEIIADIRIGLGPMGGIESGLTHFAKRSDAVMFVPCDLPNITSQEILTLKKAFVKSEKPVVFAETAGFFWHPLCAVVHNDLRKKISVAVDNGEHKVRTVWQQVKAVAVQFADETAFFNINTLADMDKCRKAKNEKKNLR